MTELRCRKTDALDEDKEETEGQNESEAAVLSEFR